MRTTVAFLLWGAHAASAVFPQQPRLRSLIDGLPKDLYKSSLSGRKLQDDTNGTACSICGTYKLLSDYIPPYEPTADLPNNLTCADLEFMAASVLQDDGVCVSFQNLFPNCCEGGPPTYECEKQIRASLLDGYDTATPPIISTRTPLVVNVDLTFMTVTDLDPQKGTAEIFVWLQLEWNDPRLAWTIGPETCADVLSVRASWNAETSEIWSPDFDLYNVVNGVQQFPDAMADLFSNGTVLWRRGGSLKAICQFTGLAKIPFDTLGCQFLLGPWTRRGFGHIQYELSDGVGFHFGDFSPTYNEFKLILDLVETRNNKTDSVISYVFYFERATEYYLFNIVIPTAILTYVSFGTFLLDLRVGERLSFGMALALVLVAQQIVTGDLLPVSNESLWIDKFVGWSFYWVIFGLVESVVVGYVFFLREDFPDPEPVVSTRDEPRIVEENEEELEVDTPNGTQSNRDDIFDQTPHDPNLFSDQSPSEYDRVVAPDEEGFPRQAPLTLKQRIMRTRSGRNPMKWVPMRWVPMRWVPRLLSLPRWVYTFPLRRVDHVCFFLSTITYTIFIIAMFVSVPKWGQGIDPIFKY
jgi:hypothetical protein